MKRYNPKEIEPKWQDFWQDKKIYEADDKSNKPKKYILEYFPYPSGATMHVGHVRNYTIGDSIARFNRMSGFNVLHPMGWDAFGLPAENYAIKTGVSPRVAIDENTSHFKKQLIQMGFGYDWSREIDSTKPEYYKWTQWFFLFLFEKGLAYQKQSSQFYCPKDQTVLANEQVENGLCWRCGSKVEKKSLKQWFFKITDYADRLVKDLDDVNWSESIKSMQRNWIGRSVGSEVDFSIDGSEDKIRVYTTRIDTIYGTTFLVVAPEHPILGNIVSNDQKVAVDEYVKQSQIKSEIDRQETNREKTGVFSGSYVVNPLTKAKIPIWIADYVLYGYGTGAIMAVPAHDERDLEFAKKFNIDVIQVIKPSGDNKEEIFTGEGTLINSDKYNDLSSSDAREKITLDLAQNGSAEEKVNYKLRDWLISRQRYWGAPIPIIHCPTDGIVPVPKDHLPVLLPELDKFVPGVDGKSPLASIDSFVNTTCPKCGGSAKRETDTMDGFACSSWYFLRFADPHNDSEAFSRSLADYWLPVDDYIGGAEHAVMHLLYARFWTKVMFDDGLINFTEPFTTLRNQGMILAHDGQKMSKSKNNTVNPDELISQGYGADSIRLMELFIGPWNQSANWSTEGLSGTFRFLQRVWNVTQEYVNSASAHEGEESGDLLKLTHETIKKVTANASNLDFNTSISALMEMVNELYKLKIVDEMDSKSWNVAIPSLLKLLAPFAPHITEELWHDLGNHDSIHISSWPEYDEKYLVSDSMEIVVQVNGKVRAKLTLPTSYDENKIFDEVLSNERVSALIKDQELIKKIYIPGKLVSLVVK